MSRFPHIKLTTCSRSDGKLPELPEADFALNEAIALKELNRAVEWVSEIPPSSWSGKGIIICGDRRRYFPSAWVCINLLRSHGCTLPIEYWHLGPDEIHPTISKLLSALSVMCVDALDLCKLYPVRCLGGWELKCFALLHSQFREILLIDADNVPLVDPTYLFDTSAFRDCGSVFWPDHGRLPQSAKIWELTDVAYRLEQEFESGQILLNKSLCWQALHLAMWFNSNSDFWYKYIYGDKDTFHFAWRKLDQPYAMPQHGVLALPATMCQHDFNGRRIFQHRNKAKWMIRNNRTLRGFALESQCLEFIEGLVPYWKEIAGVSIYHASWKNVPERNAAKVLASERWIYHRVGHEQRPMTFAEDGTIREGMAELEVYWDVIQDGENCFLDIQSEGDRTCRLRFDVQSSKWVGRWDCHEQMPIELMPAPSRTLITDEALAREEEEFVRDFFGDTLGLLFARVSENVDFMKSIADVLLLHGWSDVTYQSEWARFLEIAQMVGFDTPPKVTEGDRNELAGSRFNAFGIPDLTSVAGSVRVLSAPDVPKIHFLGFDWEAIRQGITLILIKFGIRPRLILWRGDRYPESVRRHEELLTECGFVQVFQNSRSRGWAFIGQAGGSEERATDSDFAMGAYRRPNLP